MAGSANLIRIIGGTHRGRRLQFASARGLRPTPDRVRETLFNWLRDDVMGARCLDLFAGSGALGFEAVSRGARSVTMVEHNRVVAQRLRDNAALLRETDKVLVKQLDARRFLQAPPKGTFDIVFLDPPFADNSLASICERLISGGWLSRGCAVYLEQDAARAWTVCPGALQVVRESSAGQSAQRLLRCSTAS